MDNGATVWQGPVTPVIGRGWDVTDVSVAGDATRHDELRERRTAPTRLRPTPREPMPTFEPDAGAALHAANVETPRRDSMRRRALAAADVLALLAAYGVLSIVASPPVLLLAAIPFWVVLNKSLRLYDRDANLVHQSTLNELPKIFHSLSLGAALALLLGVTSDRTEVLVWWLAAMALTPAFRFAAREIVRRRTAPERVLVIGAGHVAALVARKITGHPEYGSELVGYVHADGDRLHAEASMGGLRCLGSISNFERICREADAERVIVAFSSAQHERLLDVIRISKRLRVKISVVPRLFEVIGAGVEIDQVEGMTLLGIRGLTRTTSTLAMKRATDIVGASLGLLLLAPLFAVIAVAIKLTSQGSVFFLQERVGRGNRVFHMWKFRTMVRGARHQQADLAHLNEMEGGAMFKIADDPRITPVGRILRRASLDELPQLWNVLRGEMSLVGPRPLVPAENDQVMGWHRTRLDLTPGLTGPWQVMGRNAIPFQEMVKLDYLYVTDWSLWSDIKLLLRTLPVVVGRRGA
jgi:exopolysaccharide biosynthesis polyprenyl glycosylphosphotransferase